MNQVERAASVKEAAKQLYAATGLSQIPAHVTYRLHALLGGDPVLHLDSDVDIVRAENGPDVLRGRILGFTEHVAVLFSLDGTTARPQSDEAATVRAEAWPRAALRSLALEPDGNTDDHWTSGQHSPWPRGAHVRLHYAGRSEPVTLPLSPEGGDRLGEFLPLLVHDLLGARH